MFADLITQLQEFVDTLPLALQVIAVLIIGMVPALEGDVAAAIGIVAGVPWLLTVLVGAGGTVLTTLGAVAWGSRIGDKRRKGERERKIMARVEKWGIPIAMFIGGFLVSVAINAFVMSAAGLNRTIVLISGIATAIFNTLFVALVAAGILQAIL